MSAIETSRRSTILPDDRERARGEQHRRDAAPLVRHRVEPLRVGGHHDEHERERGQRGRGRAADPVGRDQQEVQRDVDRRRRAGDHPVELRPAQPSDPDRDDGVPAPQRARKGKRCDDVRSGPERFVPREHLHDPRREHPERERQPAGDEEQVREHERVGSLRLALVVDRVRERRPRCPERDEQQHHRRRDAHADRVAADVVLARQPREEEAVAEVERPERDARRDERKAEPVHSSQQLAVELESELLAAVAEEREIHEQRSGEVPDDDAERPLVVDDDEQDRRGDREQHVREARRDERDRALLDAEERRQLLVVHLRPQADERGAHERDVVDPERVREPRREDPAGDHTERGHAHREPERRAQHAHAVGRVRRVEVEAEERGRDPCAENRDEDRAQRDERLDLAEVARREVARVERQQQHRQDPGDEPAEPVDRGVLAEPPELRADHRMRA